MVALISWTERKPQRKETVQRREVLRLPVMEALIYKKGSRAGLAVRRRCQAAARQLQRMGITRGVFPREFPCLEEFARYGIFPVDTLPMYRGLTGELVQAALEQQGASGRSAVVAVCADQLTAEVRQTVTDLCIRNRYVQLDAPDRKGAFCRQLRREYGVPLVVTGEAEQLSRAGVVVLFSPRCGLQPHQKVLELYPEGKRPDFLLKLAAEEELPEDYDRAQLLAALWTAGILRLGQITVEPEKKANSVPSFS